MSYFGNYQTFKTIAKLKGLTAPQADIVYYLSETGREGEWYYDAADTSTAEDTGLVLVTTTGSLRLKRSLKGQNFIRKSWFSGTNIYFNDVADVNATIPSASRFQGMVVYLLVSGTLAAYWYRDGILDANLVVFAIDVTISNGPITGDRTQNLLSAPTPTTLQMKSIGISANMGIPVVRTSNPTTEDFMIDFTSIVFVTRGTYAQRPVSPTIGQEFYQTDILEGKYVWDGLNWTFQPDNNTVLWTKFYGDALTQFTPVLSGTGAAQYQSPNRFHGRVLETGTDTTGSAQLKTTTSALTLGGTTGKIIQYTKFVVPITSTSTDRFAIRIGRPIGADGAGVFFKAVDNLDSGILQGYGHNGTSGLGIRMEVAPLAANTVYEVTSVFDLTGTDTATFYLNNVFKGNVTLVPTSFPAGSAYGTISIEKLTGSNSRTIEILETIIKRIL